MEKNQLLGTYEQNPYASGDKRYGSNGSNAATVGPVDKTGYIQRDAERARMAQAQQQMRPAVMPPRKVPSIGRGIPNQGNLMAPTPRPQKQPGLPTNGSIPPRGESPNPVNNPALRKNVYLQWMQDNLSGSNGRADALRRGF